MAISSIFTSAFSTYQYTSDNALLRIKLAGAERLQKEYAAIRDKYDGSKQASYEKELSDIVDRKAAVGGFLDNVQTGLKKMDEIRNQLIALRNAIDVGGVGSAEAFDLAYSSLNQLVGTAKPDGSGTLGGNNRSVYGTWPEPTRIASGGSTDISVVSRFIGNDYGIELDDGSGLVFPNASDKAMQGGSVSALFTDISDVTIDTATSQITFTDNSSGSPVVHTGTLKRGGGTVLNAWAYNNFANESDRELARADVDAAIKRVASVEREWNMAEAQLNGSFKTLGVKQDEAKAAFEKVSYEVLDAKNAELKAAKARFELSINSLALTQGRQSDFIYNMFVVKPPGKTTMTDVMFSMNGY